MGKGQRNGFALSSGFGLVEIMVGIVIGLLTILAATQIYATFEGQKRTTVHGGDARTNGMVALHIIEQDVRPAGYGVMTAGRDLPCLTIRAYNSELPGNYTITMAPILIHDGGAGADAVTTLYSTASTAGIATTTLAKAMPSSSAVFFVNSVIALKPNDLVVISEPGLDCALVGVTSVNDVTNNVVHNSGNRPPNNKHNPPGGHNIFPEPPGCTPNGNPPPRCGYNVGARVTNFGQLVNRQYDIDKDSLRVTDLSKGATAAAVSLVADGVVTMQAVYGVSLNKPPNTVDHTKPADDPLPAGDNITDWVPATGVWAMLRDADGNLISPDAVRLRSIRAVRLALVARSNLQEKTEVSPATLPLWKDGPSYAVPDQKYRYHVYQTIIPLRNMVWGN